MTHYYKPSLRGVFDVAIHLFEELLQWSKS